MIIYVIRTIRVRRETVGGIIIIIIKNYGRMRFVVFFFSVLVYYIKRAVHAI